MDLARTLVYTYDRLYRLTGAATSSGEQYAYAYFPVGNRLQQIIDGDTTDYQYDAANRLTQVNGQDYTWDDRGNLLSTGVMTNEWDAANRLVAVGGPPSAVSFTYNRRRRPGGADRGGDDDLPCVGRAWAAGGDPYGRIRCTDGV